jgi:S-DNA-T family DNA segregation ATPase FtsK/SpoIIIE
MLFLWPGTSTLLRGQGTYLSDDEINAVVETVSTGEQNFVNELVNMKVETEGEVADPGQLRKRDELYESAIDIVVREGRGSVSLLQRALGIGYGRAARLVDFMAEDGFVGEYNGSQAREVLLTIADWEKMQGQESTPDSAPPPKPRRTNVVRPEPDDGDAVSPRPRTAKAGVKTLEPDEDLHDTDDDFDETPPARGNRAHADRDDIESYEDDEDAPFTDDEEQSDEEEYEEVDEEEDEEREHEDADEDEDEDADEEYEDEDEEEELVDDADEEDGELEDGELEDDEFEDDEFEEDEFEEEEDDEEDDEDADEEDEDEDADDGFEGEDDEEEELAPVPRRR